MAELNYTIREVEQACEEIRELVRRFCGGEIRQDILTQDHPWMSLAPA